MTTGRLANGAFMLNDKNGLFKAVNNNGAVSPLTLAKANKTPVITPLWAAFRTTERETFHFGAPSANAASRKLTGTKLNIFSVVRTTTGMAIKVSAKGAVSMYGMGRWPVTLYRSQWERLIESVDQIKAFIEANSDVLNAIAAEGQPVVPPPPPPQPTV